MTLISHEKDVIHAARLHGRPDNGSTRVVGIHVELIPHVRSCGCPKVGLP